MHPGLSQGARIVQLSGPKIYHAAAVVLFPRFQSLALQRKKVDASGLGPNALKESIAKRAVAVLVGFTGVALTHERVVAQIIGVGGLHVKIHAQQVQHSRRKFCLCRGDGNHRDDAAFCVGSNFKAANAVNDIFLRVDHNRHQADFVFQCLCKLPDVRVKFAVVLLCQPYNVHVLGAIDARERFFTVRVNVRQAVNHGINIHFV